MKLSGRPLISVCRHCRSAEGRRIQYLGVSVPRPKIPALCLLLLLHLLFHPWIFLSFHTMAFLQHFRFGPFTFISSSWKLELSCSGWSHLGNVPRQVCFSWRVFQKYTGTSDEGRCTEHFWHTYLNSKTKIHLNHGLGNCDLSLSHGSWEFYWKEPLYKDRDASPSSQPLSLCKSCS